MLNTAQLSIEILKHTRPDLASLPLTQWFDNSRLENYTKCPRYAYYSDFLSLDNAKAVMHAGTVMHHAVEKNSEIELLRKWQEFNTWFKDDPQYSASRFVEVYNAYLARYAASPVNSISKEFPLAWYYAPEDFWLVGRCDEIIIHVGKLSPFERKTTSGIRPDYIGDKNVSNQRLQYLFICMRIAEENGFNPREVIGGIMFDVIAWNKSKIDFARWHQPLPSENVFNCWFEEVKQTVDRYREDMNNVTRKTKLPNKRRAQCHIYGKCAYLDLCNAWELTDSFDPPAIINNFRKKNWKPF